MSLSIVVDTLAARLGDAGVAASDRRPSGAGELPHVAITIDDAVQPVVGIGEIPRGPQSGSLPVTSTVDLSDPVLQFGDDTVELVSEDRLTFVIPHGPVVRSEEMVVVDDDGPYTLVDAPPAGREVSVDVDLGELTFGQALPATGTLQVDFFVGIWDVTNVRFSGSLALEVLGAGAAPVAVLSRAVAEELGRPDPVFARLTPVAWGATAPTTVGADAAHGQILRYRFDFELEQPSLPTGGGVIRTVAVTSATDGATEQYDVTHEGSGP